MTDAGGRLVLAIDLGTSGAKAGLVALDGRLVALAREPYPSVLEPAEGIAEQDPDAWWHAVASSVRALGSHVADVVAIGIDGHGPTLTAVDRDGRPTRAAITWRDTRARTELDELALATGLRGWALGVLPAALWVERHEAEVARATCWYLNSWEALALRLTGVAATSLVEGQPFPERPRLAAAGIAVDRIAPPAAAGSVVGEVSKDAADALGLRAGIPVAAGLVDAFASFHGARLLDAGDAIDAGGAAGGFGVYWGSPVEARGSFCTPGPLAGRFIVGGAMAATGQALDWFRDGIAGGVATETLLAEAAEAPPGSDGLVFLPYLAGERSPLWDPQARGAFVGLTLGHTRGHLVRAILEGAAFAIRHVAAPILEAGVRVDTMAVAGGPARSELWNRIKADITGFPVLVPAVRETAVVGSAAVAATAIGAYPDVRAAIRGMVRIDHRIDPDETTRATYDRAFRAYLDVHPAIQGALTP